MAKKSRHSVSRKCQSRRKPSHQRQSRRKQSHKRRTVHRRRGGSAPVQYSLADNWSSQISKGQGADYFNYHRGQHGGVAPLSALGGELISPEMRGPAHVGGIDKALQDVSGLKDQAGGRRKSRRNKSRKSRKSRRNNSRKDRRNKSRRNKSRRSHGGGTHLTGAPFPSQGMLLDSQKSYAQAGLNPEWRTDVAFDLAKARQGM